LYLSVTLEVASLEVSSGRTSEASKSILPNSQDSRSRLKTAGEGDDGQHVPLHPTCPATCTLTWNGVYESAYTSQAYMYLVVI